jgi:hypothetical protein
MSFARSARPSFAKIRAAASFILISLTLAACGGGSSGTPADTPTPTPTAQTYTIGGSVSGLTGTGLVLQDSGGDNLSIASGASVFTFATPVATSAAYAVTVLTQPANQTCTVANGSGTVAAANVTNIAITCSSAYTIGGTVSGMVLSGNLVLTRRHEFHVPNRARQRFVLCRYGIDSANGRCLHSRERIRYCRNSERNQRDHHLQEGISRQRLGQRPERHTQLANQQW